MSFLTLGRQKRWYGYGEGNGVFFIVFRTAETACTTSAMPCYCLCSRSRLALPQLQDNSKLCLTETFSLPPPPLPPPFCLNLSVIFCSERTTQKSVLLCCKICTQWFALTLKKSEKDWVTITIILSKSRVSVHEKARGLVALCFSKGCLGNWHMLHLLSHSLQVVEMPGWHSDGWQQEGKLLLWDRAETLPLIWIGEMWEMKGKMFCTSWSVC